MMILNSDWRRAAIRQGEVIHRMVCDEGGYMVHGGEKSWFEKRVAPGQFVRVFSPGLMAKIRASREELRVYAAERRDELEHRWDGVDADADSTVEAPRGEVLSEPSQEMTANGEVTRGN